jgi:hypothetical protein
MNERIKELWSQAGGHYDSGNQHTWPQYTIDDPERFAELIVRECLDIVNRKEYSYHETDPLWETAQLIKEHFGVED